MVLALFVYFYISSRFLFRICTVSYSLSPLENDSYATEVYSGGCHFLLDTSLVQRYYRLPLFGLISLISSCVSVLSHSRALFTPTDCAFLIDVPASETPFGVTSLSCDESWLIILLTKQLVVHKLVLYWVLIAVKSFVGMKSLT